jgi:hypothetical protein
VSVGAVEVSDEVGGGFQAPVRHCAEILCRGNVPSVGGEAGQGVEGEHFDMGFVSASGVVEDHGETVLGVGVSLDDVQCGEQAIAERCLFSTAGGAVPCSGRLEHDAGFGVGSERSQHSSEMNSGEGGHPQIACRLGLVDGQLQGGRADLVVTGLALRSSEAGELVGLGLLEAETS